MRIVMLFAVCLLQASVFALGEIKYSVIGPRYLHSGHKYNVAVAVHQTSEPCQIKVGISGPAYNATQTVDLQSDEVTNLEFDVPYLEEEGEYNLTAEGLSGLIFQNSTKLEFKQFQPHVKIQTDKGLYKPGDVVNYRVIFLDELLKPAAPSEDTIIWFEDAKRNRIKEIKDFKVVKGVYTGLFEISEFPLLGHWRILVKGGKQQMDKQVSFQVNKYVLPKYTIKLEATEKVCVKDGDMQVVVRANYTYGKPVSGKATIILELDTWYYRQDHPEFSVPPNIIRTADMVDGKAKFDLNIKEWETDIPEKTSTYGIQVKATVEENFTDVKLNATTHSSLYPYRYDMNCANYDNCHTFHADKEHTVEIAISHIDGTPVKDTKSIVKLTYKEDMYERGYYEKEEERPPKPVLGDKTLTFESHMNESGIAAFKVTLPALEEFEGYSHFYKMEAWYLDEKRMVLNTYQYVPPPKPEEVTKNEEPKEWFRVAAKYKEDEYNYKLGEECTLELNSSQPLSYFVYNVIGKGNVLHSARVELTDKPKVYELKFKTTRMMSPTGQVYIHYVDEKGDFHWAENMFHVDSPLENELEITAPEEVKPGEDVALSIKTAINSYVGLLAVDQSVLLLGANNDFNRDHISWEFGDFMPRRHWGWHWGGGNPGDSSGMVTLTNAAYKLIEDRHLPIRHQAVAMSALGEATTFCSAPMAMADAGNGLKRKAGGGPRVRKDFSETWLFADIENTESEKFEFVKKIPDTITSWVVTGFSLHADKGLGLTKEPTKVRTFLPFFIAIRLPYSVKRGEVINVPALVFNYLTKDLDVEITLDNVDDEYDFLEVSNEVINEQKRQKTLRIPANGARGTAFLIRPKIVGNIMLKFTAISPVAGDAIHKTLKVEAEGITEYINRAYFIKLKDEKTLRESLPLELPKEIVPDSEHIEISVVGDVLGPLLKNIDRFVRLPMGCGEQTMSAMVPNYLVLRYLKSTNRLTAPVEAKITRNLESGYQNLLHYRHEDGSFSSFGPAKEESDSKPRNGSTWLTAYVVRYLRQMEEFIKVDEKMLAEAEAYLIQQQAENGSFTEKGDGFYSAQKHHVTLTATVLLALMENKHHTTTFEKNLANSFKYIQEQYGNIEGLHAKVFAAYTMYKAKQSAAAEYIAQLSELKKTEGEHMWFAESKERARIFCCCFFFSRDVEITAYMMLTMLDMESVTVDEMLPILKWLVAQRNSYGGFYSTQDTVVGLQALIKFAEKSGYEPAEMDIDFSAKGGKEKHEIFKVTPDNGLLMQTFELPVKTRSVEFEALGKGTALVQVSYQYNVQEKDKTPSFTLTANINKKTAAFKLEMDVCVQYIGEGESSNMAVVEVSLPSGYVADSDSFERIKQVERVRLVETKNADSVIIIYFESLHKGEPQVLPIEALKSFAVAMQKPSAIVVYDYYDTTRRATTYYEVVSKMCDLCVEDEGDCETVCA